MSESPGQETGPLLEAWRTRIDAALGAALDLPASPEPRLADGMRHAVLFGGKRMRPLLVHAAGHACGAEPETLDAVGKRHNLTRERVRQIDLKLRDQLAEDQWLYAVWRSEPQMSSWEGTADGRETAIDFVESVQRPTGSLPMRA